MTARSMEGEIPSRSFPHDIFEEAILSLLREVDPADVLGKEPESESAAVAADLAVKEQRSGQIEAELAGEGDDVPSLVRVLRKLNDDCTSLRKRLAVLRRRKATLASSVGRSLDLVDVAKDEASRCGSRTPANHR